MRLAIMQPYFLPYIGYWQLMEAVDVFVVYDRIKYTKKGWINRNRMLQNGGDAMFSIPLAQGSDSLMVCERQLAPTFDRRKLLAQMEGAYQRAPEFESLRALLNQIVLNPADNLFDYLWQSINAVHRHLGLTTKLIVSSSVEHDETLRSQEKVLAICEALGATTYINAIGGLDLYQSAAFAERGIELKFHKAQPIEYPQCGDPFVPWLSIIDVLAFNSQERVNDFLDRYDLI